MTELTNAQWDQEMRAQAEAAVVTIIDHIGEDSQRDGLRDTPARVVRAFSELTVGYKMDPAKILATTFDVAYDELVIVRAVPFWSLCEHHMLPFRGTATVAYVPRDRVVGLSKLARLVECFARRLQVQERMTGEISQAMTEHLNPLATGVIVKASHSCMAMRGIQRDAEMVTSKLTGLLRERADLRAEFLALAGE